MHFFDWLKGKKIWSHPNEKPDPDYVRFDMELKLAKSYPNIFV